MTSGTFDHFGTIRSNYLGMVQPDGALELYHGGLRVKDAQGDTLFDHLDYCKYKKIIDKGMYIPIFTVINGMNCVIMF